MLDFVGSIVLPTGKLSPVKFFLSPNMLVIATGINSRLTVSEMIL
jgi:hypothetical protein